MILCDAQYLKEGSYLDYNINYVGEKIRTPPILQRKSFRQH